MEVRHPTAREEEAAYWYLKLQEPHASAEDIQAALAWQADPENRAAFERVATFWRAWPQTVPVAARTHTPKQLRSVTPWQAAAVLLVIVSVGLWAALSQRQEARSVVMQEYATGVGEVRTVRLEDGTDVILGGATSIRAHFADNVRRVVMSDGEALFFVAKDQRRPFIVDLPNGSARALGTTFNVHHGPDESTITVLEGLVQVSPPSWRSGASTNAGIGTEVAVSPDGVVGSLREVNPQEVASWRSGRMIFVDRTLRSVVADLNRYSHTPITLAAAGAADVQVSGNIKLNQIEEWLRALGPAFGIEVVRNEHGLTLVSRMETPASSH